MVRASDAHFGQATTHLSKKEVGKENNRGTAKPVEKQL
jgi:hypothetical protein